MNKDAEYLALQKEREGLIHISYSEFSQYLGCGHRHLLEKFLKLVDPTTSIHLIFGNAIHAAIETGLKQRIVVEERVAAFKEKFVKDMMDNLLDSPEYQDMNAFMDQGENLIRILNVEGIFEKYDIIGVELALYEPIWGKYHFKGFIDLIVRDKKTGRYVIIDWKTSGEQWDVSKKKKDVVFMSQMRFYKYFYSRKFNIPFDQIDCRYVVLNRLLSKKCPELGFGKLQPVDIHSTEAEIEQSLRLIAETMRDIHIRNFFPKAKLNNEKSNCFFCPYKNNPTLCNQDPNQYKQLLVEHGK